MQICPRFAHRKTCTGDAAHVRRHEKRSPVISHRAPAQWIDSVTNHFESTPGKKWVPDYKQVWVEDSTAWDEQVPIYSDIEVSVCNVCGAEITGNEAVHAKQHALAGEGGGHHNDYRSVITGYETIHHDATGHYETVEDGGHWE